MRRLALLPALILPALSLPALILAAVLLGGAADDSGGSAGRPGHYGYMDGRDLPAATRDLAWALIRAGGAEPAPIGRNPRVMAAVDAITRAAEDGDAAAAQVLDLLRATKLAEAATALAAIATAHPSAQAERTLAVIAGLTSMRRATYTYARAAELDPSDAESRFCVADAARRAGRIDDAVAGFRAVLALTEGDEASRARFWSLAFLARIDHERGNAVMALEGYAAARELAEHLAAAQPFNAEYQHNLLVVLDWTGYALMDRQRMAEAETVFLDARGIAERMAASDRSARDWQAYAADSLMSLADLHGRQNDMAGALALRRSALEIRARIAHDAPDGPEWQTALAATQARVGATILAAHAPVDEAPVDEAPVDEALAVLQAGLAIRTQQAEAAPDDAEAQRALLRDLASAGHALLRRTALTDAQDMFSRAITVAKVLHEAAPDTAEWTRALARAHENAGDAFVQQNADAPAAASFGAARTLWRGLDPAAQDDDVQWALVDVCSKLGEAQAGQSLEGHHPA
jgi:tetratricopeptide (TPR) repeat protein